MKKNTTKLKLDRRLGSYLTLGVGAGVLGSQSSNAAIVYFDFTPLTITSGRVWVNPSLGTRGTGNTNVTPTIGLNFAGSEYIYSHTELNPSLSTTPKIAFGAANQQIIRFATNQTIGASSAFKNNWSYMDRPGWTTAQSAWATGLDGTSGFMGFTFKNAGVTNYGWIEVTYNDASNTIVMGDFAYENNGGSILAGATGVPEPSSLGLLALGATGLLTRRRRQAA